MARQLRTDYQLFYQVFMKFFLSLCVLGASLSAMAQTNSSASVNTTINDDGKTMSIQVTGERNGKSIRYNRAFDVAKLKPAEKEAMKNRILDSLGVGEAPPAPPKPAGAVGIPTPPTPPGVGQSVVTFQCETCAGKVKLMVASASEDFTIERDAKADTDKRLFPYQLPLSPGEYALKYYQNGVLQIQSTFTVRAGEKSTVVVK